MKRITYKDLQLEIELELEAKIQRILDDNLISEGLNKKIDLDREKQFYELIKNAIEIDNHFAVDSIKERLFEAITLEKNVKVRIFLYQDDRFNIYCFPRNENSKEELLIFVSQHFFNNLDEDEQIGILGHEISHLIFDHLKFPIVKLINFSFESGSIGQLKQFLIYYSKLKEVSADMIGLVSCNLNFKAYSSALIKFTTGINDSRNSSFNLTPLISIVLDQYEKHLKNPNFYDLHSTHPLMPARVKIINEIASSKLLRYFGDEVSDSDFKKYKKEYNERINNILKKTYPEIFPNESKIDRVLIPMSVAVMLADGVIDKGEVSLVEEMIDKSKEDFSKLRSLFPLGKIKEDVSSVRLKFIEESVKLAKDKEFNKSFIVPIIRALIIVAASDGNIDKSEMQTIYLFAKEFGFSKIDIVMLVKTQDVVN